MFSASDAQPFEPSPRVSPSDIRLGHHSGLKVGKGENVAALNAATAQISANPGSGS
jgi:hypothetical protein